MAKLSVNDLDLRGKRVLMRVDYNVPLETKEGRTEVTDVTRIKATLPTLELLVRQGARTVLMAHLGRPKGKADPALSLRPVASELAELIGRPVAFAHDCIGDEAEKTAATLQPGDLLLLENLRFHPEEEANDPAFAEQLAKGAEVYIDDAFGAAHRAHASTVGVPKAVAAKGGPCLAGLLMERELKFLGDELENPARPFVVILGGAKVSDKIQVIGRLLDKADALLIGGGMGHTFKLAQGFKVGKSLCEPDKVEVARKALEKAKARGVELLLPQDHVVARPVQTDKLDKKGRPVVELRDAHVHREPNIPDDEEGADIGPETVKLYVDVVARAKTILWNGPMGIFEDARFAQGTFAVARAVAEATQKNRVKSIIGGGDSVKALNKAGLGDQVTFMSTGGGASLEFLEGKVLPGVEALTGK